MWPNPWSTYLHIESSSGLSTFLVHCSPIVISLTGVLILSSWSWVGRDSQSVPLLQFMLSTQITNFLLLLIQDIIPFRRSILMYGHGRIAYPPPTCLMPPFPPTFPWPMPHPRPKFPPHPRPCPCLSIERILQPDFVWKTKCLKKVTPISRVGKFFPGPLQLHDCLPPSLRRWCVSGSCESACGQVCATRSLWRPGTVQCYFWQTFQKYCMGAPYRSCPSIVWRRHCLYLFCNVITVRSSSLLSFVLKTILVPRMISYIVSYPSWSIEVISSEVNPQRLRVALKETALGRMLLAL